MIIDVTDPANPVEKSLIPSPPGGQSQMVRMCLGSVLPGGTGRARSICCATSRAAPPPGYEHLGRNRCLGARACQALTGIRSTHKDWWECKTGIAYMPGSKNSVIVPGTPLWRQSQAMLIYDWSNPHNGQPPVYIRTFGLPGGQPNATGPVPNSLHGAISAYEHPNAAGALARARRRPNDDHRQPHLRGVGRG